MIGHSTRRLHPLSLACMMLAGTLGPQATSVALAQEATLEEVVVTARKRSENLMDIPESVTAISGLAIE